MVIKHGQFKWFKWLWWFAPVSTSGTFGRKLYSIVI